jgi:hypothetical protein
MKQKYGVIECGGNNKTFTSGSCLPNPCDLSSDDNKKVTNGFFKSCDNGDGKKKASTTRGEGGGGGGETNLLSYDRTCDIQCKPGYRLRIPSMKTYKCQVSGGKNIMVNQGDAMAVCEKIKCDKPSKTTGYLAKKGKLPLTIDLLDGKKNKVKCSGKYVSTKTEDPFLTCNGQGTYNNKKWVNTNYTFNGCQEGKCILKNPSNTQSTSDKDIKIGEEYKYSCNTGYKSVAEKGKTIDVNKIQVDCKKISGKATIVPNAKEKVMCGITKCNLNQDKVSKSKFGGSGCTGSTVNYGQTCNVVCDVGTKLANEKNQQYKCLIVSNKNKMIPTKKSAACSDLTCDVSSVNKLKNGAGGDCRSALGHNGVCTPTCNKGYTLSGKMKCDFSKKTPLSIPKCNINSCNPGNFIRPKIQLQGYKNNVLQDISELVDCNNKKHNQKCEVTCPSNYTIENGGGVGKVEYTCDASNQNKVIWKSNISGQNIEVTSATKATTKKFTCRFASCFTNKNINNTVEIPNNITYKYKDTSNKDTSNKDKVGYYRQGDRILKRTFNNKTTTCIGRGKCYFKCAPGYVPKIDGKSPKAVINNDKQIGIVECSTKNSSRNAECAPLPCNVKNPVPKYPNGVLQCKSDDVDKKGILQNGKTCELECNKNIYGKNKKTYKCNLGELEPVSGSALSCNKLTCPNPIIPTMVKMDIIKKVLDKKTYNVTLRCKEGSQFNDKDTWQIPVPNKTCGYICPGQKTLKNCTNINGCSVQKPCLHNNKNVCFAMNSANICPTNTTLCNNIKVGCPVTPPKCISCPPNKVETENKENDKKYCGQKYWENRESNKVAPPYIYISSNNKTTEYRTKNFMKSNSNKGGKGTKWNPYNIYDGIYAKTKKTGIMKGSLWIPPIYTRIPNFYEELCGLTINKGLPNATLTFNHLGRGFNGPRDYSGRWELKVNTSSFEKQWNDDGPKDTKNYKGKEWTIVRYPEGKLSDISPLTNAEMDIGDVEKNLTNPRKFIMNTRINLVTKDINKKAFRSSEHDVDIVMVAITDETTFEKVKKYKDCYGTPKKRLLII